MLIGYARVSKSDGSQSLDLQFDALKEAGVAKKHIYHDMASGKKDGRPGRRKGCLESGCCDRNTEFLTRVPWTAPTSLLRTTRGMTLPGQPSTKLPRSCDRGEQRWSAR